MSYLKLTQFEHFLDPIYVIAHFRVNARFVWTSASVTMTDYTCHVPLRLQLRISVQE